MSQPPKPGTPVVRNLAEVLWENPPGHSPAAKHRSCTALTGLEAKKGQLSPPEWGFRHTCSADQPLAVIPC